MVEGQRRLDQSGDARSMLDVPDIGLDRSNCAVLGPGAASPERFGQARKLDHIANRCPRAVGFDV